MKILLTLLSKKMKLMNVKRIGQFKLRNKNRSRMKGISQIFGLIIKQL